jgi:hypothetical protein
MLLGVLIGSIIGFCAGILVSEGVKSVKSMIHGARNSCWLGHNWSGWIENLGKHAVNSRYRQCGRCFKIQVGK